MLEDGSTYGFAFKGKGIEVRNSKGCRSRCDKNSGNVKDGSTAHITHIKTGDWGPSRTIKENRPKAETV